MDFSIFIPCSSKYHACEDFKKLPVCHQLTTLFVTALATVATLGLGSVAAFRYMVGRFTLIIDSTNPVLQETAARTDDLAKRIRDYGYDPSFLTGDPEETESLIPQTERERHEDRLSAAKTLPRTPSSDQTSNAKPAPKTRKSAEEEKLDEEFFRFMDEGANNGVDDGDFDLEEELATSSTTRKEPKNLPRLSEVEYPTNATDETLECLNILADNIHSNERILLALDTGDCFYDAYATILSKTLQRKVTPEDLRAIVSDYVNKYEISMNEKGLGKQNWIIKKAEQSVDCNHSYEQYKENVRFTQKDKEGDKTFLPIWGNPDFEGRILGKYFGVTLEMHGVSETIKLREYGLGEYPVQQSKSGLTFHKTDEHSNNKIYHTDSTAGKGKIYQIEIFECENDKHDIDFRAPDYEQLKSNRVVIKMGSYRNKHFVPIAGS